MTEDELITKIPISNEKTGVSRARTSRRGVMLHATRITHTTHTTDTTDTTSDIGATHTSYTTPCL